MITLESIFRDRIRTWPYALRSAWLSRVAELAPAGSVPDAVAEAEQRAFIQYAPDGHPWREAVREWPIARRQRYAKLAHELSVSGVAFPASERQAYLAVADEPEPVAPTLADPALNVAYPSKPDPRPWAAAKDLISYWRRTRSARGVLVVGIFDRVSWADIRPLVQQTSEDDTVIVALRPDAPGIKGSFEDRSRLARWFRFADHVVPLDRPASELAEAIGADLLLEIGGPRA